MHRTNLGVHRMLRTFAELHYLDFVPLDYLDFLKDYEEDVLQP